MLNIKKGITVEYLVVGKKYWLDNCKDESGIFKGGDAEDIFFEPVTITTYVIEKEGKYKGFIVFDTPNAGEFYETV